MENQPDLPQMLQDLPKLASTGEIPDRENLSALYKEEFERLTQRNRVIGLSERIVYDLKNRKLRHARRNRLVLISLLLENQKLLARLVEFEMLIDEDHQDYQRYSLGISGDNLGQISFEKSARNIQIDMKNVFDEMDEGPVAVLRQRLDDYLTELQLPALVKTTATNSNISEPDPEQPDNPPTSPPLPDIPLESAPEPLSTASPPDLGWSWGAFFFTWIWLVGNKLHEVRWTFIIFIAIIALVFSVPYFQLFLLIPLFWLGVASYLGRNGRRLAWEHGRSWGDAGQFNQVQRKWSIAGWLVAVLFVLVCTVPAWLAIDDFTKAEIQVERNGTAKVVLNVLRQSLEEYHLEHNRYPDDLNDLKLDKVSPPIPKEVLFDCTLSKDTFNCTAAHREGTYQFFSTYTSATVDRRPYKPGDVVKAEPLKGVSR